MEAYEKLCAKIRFQNLEPHVGLSYDFVRRYKIAENNFWRFSISIPVFLKTGIEKCIALSKSMSL